jgi:hypothetical protein
VRKIRFDETFAPGEVDFKDADVRQAGPLHAEGTSCWPIRRAKCASRAASSTRLCGSKHNDPPYK